MSDNEDRNPAEGSSGLPPHPILAKVISHLDPTYMGRLEVELYRASGNTSTEGSLHFVKYLNPFFGSTNIDNVGDTDDYANTQKSYGMWFVPPDPGTTVVVMFIDGDPRKGYWMGCVMDEAMNFAMPGQVSTGYVTEGSDRVPVAEYNKAVNGSVPDPTQVKKPKHLFATVLEEQGLIKDDTRGLTTSSARREAPSNVFGINTPGPLDKQSSGKYGPIGKAEHKIPNAPVSRLGGTSFVMDDGDANFLRMTSPSEGPPEYVSPEQGDYSGDVTRPHNELFRIRTRTGHQIVMHNSEDLIYIGNSRGTSWIEMSSDGKIDIYAEDSISIHTKQDMNFFADRDINLEAKRNVNVKATEKIQLETISDFTVNVGADGKITVAGGFNLDVTGDNKITSAGSNNFKAGANNNLAAGADTNILSGGKHIKNAAGYFSLPGSSGTEPVSAVAEPAETVTALTTFTNLDETGEASIESIMLRIPTHEPWPLHEHLDPLNLKPEKTDRESGSAAAKPDMYVQYTTPTDTFSKVKQGS